MNIGTLRVKKQNTFVPNVQGKLALIDGDVLCYHACPPRRVYADEETQVIQLGEDGKRLPPVYTEEEEQIYLEQSWDNLKNTLENLHEKLWCDDSLIAMGGGGNFRQVIFPEYKVHRHRNNAFKNETVPVLRRLAIAEGLAVYAAGLEADDLLHIWANQARSIDQDYIICSVDKDLLCIPGEHYRMHKGKEQTILVTEHEADLHYHEQLLKGDPTDNIPGLPGVGPVKAAKMLAACENKDAMQRVVLEAYFDFYGPDEWYNNLIINGKLIHILGHADDHFTLDNWSVYQELI